MSGKKIPLSDKKKVETAASAEAIEKVKHSTLGTLVRDLLGPLLAKTHFAPHNQSPVNRRSYQTIIRKVRKRPGELIEPFSIFCSTNKRN